MERWGISNLAHLRYGGHFDNWTRWFDLHRTPRIRRRRPQTYAWYTQQDGRRPIYLLDVDPGIPGCVAYPRDAILARFQTRRCASSFDWMFALAIDEGFERIELCWCRMRDTEEYAKQVPSANYWIGRAEERGIEVVIHGDSALQPADRLYGYETAQE